MHNITYGILLFMSSAPGVVDFDSEIMPIFSKAGCNVANCHGSSAGRGGFHLSLFGGDPQADHNAIVRQLEGRRINLSKPSSSLLVAKPTGMLDHGGDQPLEPDSESAKLIISWIEQGARRLQKRQLLKLSVEPRQALVSHTPAEVRLSVAATFDDGTSRDVTSLAVYSADDPAAVETSDHGRLKIEQSGQHTIVVRFLGAIIPVQVTTPLSEKPLDLANIQTSNWIDDFVYKELKALRVPPASQADKAQSLRRLTLDLTGRLPKPEHVRQFLTQYDDDTFSKKIDELLDGPEFSQYWTYKLAKLLRIRTQPRDKKGALAFHNWLHQQIEMNAPFDQLVRELLLAEGNTHEYGPANFYLVAATARGQAEYVSEALMGVRMRCANCHNHPLDRWTQDDYHGLAAIFARIERGQNVRLSDHGEVTHPRTGENAKTRLPGERFLDSKKDGRIELADWLSSKENPYFAKAIVNRLWKAMMGRGLIEPVDDLRQSNPASHPELLNRLAFDFVEHGYDLRHSLRLISNSAAYLRSSRSTTRDAAVSKRFYATATEKPLEAEVLADALADVTGVFDRYGDLPLGTRAVSLYDSQISAKSLDILGRCDRQESCEGESQSGGGLSAKLHMINGPLLNRKVTHPKSRLQILLDARKNDRQIVEELYLRALNRFSRKEELAFWKSKLRVAVDEKNRRELLEDFFWSLLSSREFTTNH